MVRALAQSLRPLLVQLNSFATGQGAAQYAVPAVAVPQSGGLFGSKRVTTPLSEPLPGVNLPNVIAAKAPELKVGAPALHQHNQQVFAPLHLLHAWGQNVTRCSWHALLLTAALACPCSVAAQKSAVIHLPGIGTAGADEGLHGLSQELQ